MKLYVYNDDTYNYSITVVLYDSPMFRHSGGLQTNIGDLEDRSITIKADCAFRTNKLCK